MQKKKLYVVLSVPFLMLFGKEKKKEEARLSLYHRYLPPVLFCFSLFGFGLATATLLRYYVAYSLFLSLSRISV